MTAPDLQYKQAVQKLREDLDLDFVGLAFVHCFNRPLLIWQYAAGNLNNHYQRIVLTSGRGVSGIVYQYGQGMIIQNVSKEIPSSEMTEYPIVLAEKLACLYTVPLWQSDEIKGVLLMAFRQADLLTREYLGRILRTIKPAFCGYAVREDGCGESLRNILKHTHPERAPVYELLPYHIMRAREDERKKISRELHDSVAQEIAAVQLKMRLIKYQKSQDAMIEIVEETDRLIGKIYNGLRSFSAALRPDILEDSGLTAAFRFYSEWIKAAYNIAVDLEENIGAVRYDAELELAFYRIGQEAILNACKHSGCERIYLSLQYKETDQEKCLKLTVIDQGQGLPVEHPDVLRPGVGMCSIRERAELINAQLTIDSEPGLGTKITLSADINAGGREKWQ